MSGRLAGYRGMRRGVGWGAKSGHIAERNRWILVAGLTASLVATKGCASSVPANVENGGSEGMAVEESTSDPRVPAHTLPTPGTPVPAPELGSATSLEGYPRGEGPTGALAPSDAYPGGVPPTRPTTLSTEQRTAELAAAEATMSAAQRSVSVAIAAALPAGATFDLDEMDDWSGVLGKGGTGLPIGLPGGAHDYVALMAASPNNVAGGTEQPFARLVWQMTETVPVPRLIAIREADLLWREREARGLQIETGEGVWLVVVAFANGAGGPEVQDAFALPGVLAASRETEVLQHRIERWETDTSALLVGSTLRDREDGSVVHRLTVYGPPFDGVAPLLATFGPDATVLDVDGDGSLEIVAAAEGGGHTVWELEGHAVVAARQLPAEVVPTPQAVSRNALPVLPADLYSYRPAGGGEVWRWPATGGAIERLWPISDLPAVPNPDLRIAAPRSDEANSTGRPPFQVARDAPVVVYALADKKNASHAVSLGFQDLAADTWDTVPITGTLGPWSVAPDGRSALYLGRGALSGVTWSYAADDAGLFHITPGKVEETRLLARCEPVSPGEPYGLLGCSTFAPDASWTNVAFGDGHGVWVVPIAGGSPRHILDHILVDTEEEIFATQVFRPVQWSPDSNWLYLYAGRYEGFTGSLLNLESGGVLDLNGTALGHDSGSTLDFAPDSSYVAITRFGHFRELAAVSIVDLSSAASDNLLSATEVTGRYNGVAGSFRPDGRFRFGTWGPGSFRPDGGFRFGTWGPWLDRYRADGVFELDLRTGTVQRLAVGLASLDPALVDGTYPPDMEWSPDAEAFALAGTAAEYASDGWYDGALVGTESTTYDASEVLAGFGYLQWSRPGR